MKRHLAVERQGKGIEGGWGRGAMSRTLEPGKHLSAGHRVAIASRIVGMASAASAPTLTSVRAIKSSWVFASFHLSRFLRSCFADEESQSKNKHWTLSVNVRKA
jgi:hypothetical protein